MDLSDEANRLARELAAETGESLTTAVTEALRERLMAVRRRRNRAAALDRIRAISRVRARVNARRGRDLDLRSPDEIVGYNEHGTFGD